MPVSAAPFPPTGAGAPPAGPSADGHFEAEAVANALNWVAAVLYLFGLGTLVVRLRQDERSSSDFVDRLPALLGFLAHLLALVARARLLGRFPVGTLPESAAFLAFLLACFYVAAAARSRFPAVEALLLGLVLGFLLLAIVLPGTTGAAASPSLHSRWFVFHTLLSFLGVTVLFAACAVSVLYLLADWQLKSKRPGALLRFLPSLVSCDRTAARLLSFGFPLLTLGVVTGLLWGHEAGTWSWGPKELLAVLAWALYGVLLLARHARGWQGRKAAILSVTAGAVALGAVLGIRP